MKLKFVQAFFRSPLVWGALAAAGFYGVVLGSAARDGLIYEYFAGHPVEYIATVMFFVGLAAVVLKAFDAVEQRPIVGSELFGADVGWRLPASRAAELLERLSALPARVQRSYLVRRVREALQHVRRNGSADKLDDHLKYLADLDAARLHDSYAMVRIITWAIPILGFLGTVIGITMALANLSPEALDDFTNLTASLSVAFNTTALALALTIVLLFAQFLTDRAETRLLAAVDRRTDELLAGRFEQLSVGDDASLGALKHMSDTLASTCQRLVSEQAALWQETIDAAHQRWDELTTGAGEHFQTALSKALAGSLQAHAQKLADAEAEMAREQRQHWTELYERNRDHWSQVERRNQEHWNTLQESLDRSAAAARDQQSELVRQGEVLLRVVDATGQVTRLEERLNENLSALSAAQDFSETVVSLSAAIQLLSARLGKSPDGSPRVDLKSDASREQAA